MSTLVQDYSRLVNQAIVECPGSSDAGIRAVLFDVFHEFFEETNCWQETITVPIVAATITYSLVCAQGGLFVRGLAARDTNNLPQSVTFDMEGLMTLRDTPNTATTWTVTVAKTVSTPLDRAGKPEIPAWIVGRFHSTVLAGLLGRLFMQPAKPYTNPGMGRYWLAKYRNNLGKVKSAVLHGNAFNANNWQFPQTFQTRNQKSGAGGSDTSFGAV